MEQLTSLCEDCLTLVPAKIVFENDKVYYLKHCPTHKEQKTLISTDINFFNKSHNKKSFTLSPPSVFLKNTERSCPFACGLCVNHKQHTAMGIVEIIDECNMRCPTCIASSGPGKGNIKTVTQIDSLLNMFVQYVKHPDLVMISGGEPTIHPEIIQIIKLAKTKPINHVMLITNGIRIANDEEFVQQLALLKENFEIYLQFDSLNPEVLVNIRGEDLQQVRIKAVENLERAKIHSTLVCVVKNNLNENEMNDIIDYALKYKYIRGVTFQPCKITGRNELFDKKSSYITLSEVRCNIVRDSKFFKDTNIIPHPLNPENICIGYLLKTDLSIIPATDLLYSNHTISNELKNKMYFTPRTNTENFKYENLFRVTIVSFLDKYNFCTSSVKWSCIHFITDKGLIPLDTYYLFHQM